MCEFCTLHGEGKKWYLNANNYASELLNELSRRRFIESFYEHYMLNGSKNISRMEKIIARRPGMVQKMAGPYEEEMRKNHFGQVIPVEDVYQILEMSTTVIRFACGCMWQADHKEERHCFGVSMGLPAWYDGLDLDYFGSPDVSRMEHLSKEDATSCIRKLDGKGLVHSVWTFGTPFIGAICNCDMKYCLAMRATYGLGMKNMFEAEHKMTVDNSKCNGCRACAEMCQLDAIELDGPDSSCHIDQAKCIGCGVCRSACDADAISAAHRHNYTHSSGHTL